MANDKKPDLMEKLLRQSPLKSTNTNVHSNVSNNNHATTITNKSYEIIKFSNSILDYFDNLLKTTLEDAKDNRIQIQKYLLKTKISTKQHITKFIAKALGVRVTHKDITVDNFKEYMRQNHNTSYKVFSKISTVVGKTSTILSGVITGVYKSVTSVFSFFKNSLLAGLTCMKDFFFGFFKPFWKVFDTIMGSLAGPIWSLIKNVVSGVVAAGKWLWSFGVKMLSYAWEGIKIIFKAGYYVISKAVKFIAKGTAGLFKWWFASLINTLINPTLWIINIPIFAIITGVLFTALGSVTSIIMDLAKPLFKGIGITSSKIIDWVWSGIMWFGKWVKNNYKDSMFETAINWIWDAIKENAFVKTMIKWASEVYNWASTNGVQILKKVDGWVTDVVKIFSNDETRPGTIFVKFLNWLNEKKNYTSKVLNIYKAPGIGTFIDYLTNRFGFLSGMQFGQDNTMSLPQMRSQLSQINQNIIGTALHKSATGLLSEGKSDEEIKKYLMENVLPQFSEYASDSGLDNDQLINSYLQEAHISFKKSSGISKDGSELTMKNLISQLGDVKYQYDLMRSGMLKATDPKIQEMLIKTRDNTNSIISKVQLQKRQKLDKSEYSPNIKHLTETINKDIFESLAKGRANTLESINTLQKSQQGVGYKLLVFSKYAAGMGTKEANISDTFKKEMSFTDRPESLKNITSVEEARLDSTVPKFKDGAAFGFKEGKPYRPLDDISLSYVKSRINEIDYKTIETDLKNKINSEKKKKLHITIIEEYVAQEDSYETYTLAQLSRGIIGV